MQATIKITPIISLLIFLAGCTGVKTCRTFNGNVPADQISVLWMPVNIDVLRVDNREMRMNIMPINDRCKYELLPGRHALSLRYYAQTPAVAEDQREIIRSPAVAFAFDGAPGRHYLLRYQTPDADAMFGRTITNLTVWVEDITGDKALLAKWEGKPAERKSAGAVGVITSAPPVASAASTNVGFVNSPASAVALPSAGETENLKQLKTWWVRAGERERGEFMKWTIERK